MHGWGQWYLFAVIGPVIACYVGARYGAGWFSMAGIGLAEVASTTAVIATGDVVSWLVDQVVVVAALLMTSAGSYRRMWYLHMMSGWMHAEATRLRERELIAADLHDTLGHDLALLSLQAAGIQVTATEPEIRERAAALRAGAAEATATVRRLVDLLHAPPEIAVPAVIARARAAGMEVEVIGRLRSGDLTARLVAEALTNAAHHAPDAAVTITADDDHIEITNPLGEIAENKRAGSGLIVLAARIEAAGGTFEAGPVDGTFRVVARVPDEPKTIVNAHSESLFRNRRMRTILVTALVVPATASLVIATGFYAWASHNTTIEPGTYRKLSVGMSQAAASRLLPPRQSAVRLSKPHGPDCREYSDGNYPLAYATYEICFSNGTVSYLRDMTGSIK